MWRGMRHELTCNGEMTNTLDHAALSLSGLKRVGRRFRWDVCVERLEQPPYAYVPRNVLPCRASHGCVLQVLSGLGMQINGMPATPGTFNVWLMANSGYLCIDQDCNNLVLDAVTRLNSSVILVGENPKVRIVRPQSRSPCDHAS